MTTASSAAGTPATPQTVAEIIERTEQAKNALDQWLGQWDEEQLTTLRDHAGWSAKDHIAHLALWMNSLAALLRHESRWEALGLGDADGPAHGIDETNTTIYERFKDSSLADVLSMYASAHRQVLNELSALQDADLQKPFAEYQPQEQRADGDQPIINWIASDAYEHMEKHLHWIEQMPR